MTKRRSQPNASEASISRRQKKYRKEIEEKRKENCSSGKVAFDSKRKADLWRVSHRWDDALNGSYLCPECKLWHVTKKEGMR